MGYADIRENPLLASIRSFFGFLAFLVMLPSGEWRSAGAEMKAVFQPCRTTPAAWSESGFCCKTRYNWKNEGKCDLIWCTLRGFK